MANPSEQEQFLLDALINNALSLMAQDGKADWGVFIVLLNGDGGRKFTVRDLLVATNLDDDSSSHGTLLHAIATVLEASGDTPSDRTRKALDVPTETV